MDWIVALLVVASPPGDAGAGGFKDDGRKVAALVEELNACLEIDCAPIRVLVGRGPAIWPELAVGLAHRDELVRFWTLGVLTEVPVAEARKDLIRLLADKAVRIRAAAAFALGAQRSPEVVEALLGALFDSDVNVRFEAASALGRVPDKRAVEPLIEVMADPDHDVRRAACEALGNIGDSRAKPTLITRLKDDRKPIVRGYAAVALGTMKATDAVGELAKRAGRERDAEAVSAMAWALGEVGSAEDGVSVAALEALEKHAQDGVRKHAGEALAAIKARAEAGKRAP